MGNWGRHLLTILLFALGGVFSGLPQVQSAERNACPVEEGPPGYGKILPGEAGISGLIRTLSHPSPVENEFCTSPLKAVCGDSSSGISQKSQERRKQTQRRQAQMLYRAQQILAERYGISVSEAQRRYPWPDSNSFTPAAQELREAYFQVQEVAVQNSEGVLRGWKEQIRASLIAAMKEDLTGVVPPEQLRALEAQVSRVRFLLPSKVFRTGMTSSLELLKGYQSVCGADGLAENAYYQGGGNVSEIVVCPGLLLSNPISSREHVLHTLAHELGHVLDVQESPALKTVYSRFEECVLWSSSDALKPGRDPKVYPGSGNPRVNVHYHASELLADYWAMRVIERQVAGSESRMEPEKALSLVSKAYGYLCDQRDEGAHPDDQYRIDLLLGSSPVLRGVFGCSRALPAGKQECRIPKLAP